MKSIRYSAPGKVILSGEHAVVYGKPALVCAIDRRLSITFTTSEKTTYLDSLFPKLELCVVNFLTERKASYKQLPYQYSIHSNLPIGRGLGSSAAYCACISAGLLELFTGKEWTKEDINICSYQLEKFFHKNSSGVDTSTSIMGGLIYYRKEFEFLKTISSLAVKIPKKFIDSLFLIDTGKSQETTGEMVQAVGTLFNSHSLKMEKIFSEMEKCTKRILVSLMKEDDMFFMKNIADNEKLLEHIGVVSDATKKILIKLKKGGVGKITGGGGKKGASGYILFYSKNRKWSEYITKALSLTLTQFIPSYKGLVKEL